MESDTQINPARGETPASQVLQSPLERPARYPTDPSHGDADVIPSEEPIRSSRGAVAGTYQVRLKLKSTSPYRSSVNSHNLSNVGVSGLEGKDLGEGQNIVELQPVDGGFGAWNY